MTPGQLQAENFQGYPPLARQVAVNHLPLLRQLPIGFLPLLLREVIAYDYKFPIERKDLGQQFTYLESMTPERLRQAMGRFAQLRIAPETERLDWVNTPGQFSEQLSAQLWATHQIDLFRAAAVEYVGKFNGSKVEEPLVAHRLAVVVIGQGASGKGYTAFRKLRPHGVHYQRVDDRQGYETILKAVAARAAVHPAPFAHWRIEGGVLDPASIEGLTSIGYGALTRVRALLQARIQKAFESGMGPEALHTALARTQPEDVGLQGTGEAAALNHFQLSLLTEGSGTQIFSTTFVQWAAREVWRRAQPLTLLAHFTPRQRESSSEEMLSEARRSPVLDPEGSLVDGDMGAYYTWINQQRLSGAGEARFLVWFEGRGEALAIAPSLGQGRESNSAVELQKLVGDLV